VTTTDYPEPRDFLDESEALHALLRERPASALALTTQFKGWTIEDVLAHLHMGNAAAEWSLSDPERLRRSFAAMPEQLSAGRSLREIQREQAGGLAGHALLDLWRDGCTRVAERFTAADPRRRVEWVGPDMSARSSISARLMETWAHAQAVYDRLGVVRVEHDRIRAVAVLGVHTFAWSFRNRGLPVPGKIPLVRLRAPSEAVWEWGEASEDRVEGSAVDFCRVVAQTRSVDDTALRVEGPVAKAWMSVAQCFAGPPQDPPAPGTRQVAESRSVGRGGQESPDV
jgi:uncharacterized protein (TIGR03084 family)